tara:strand:+ start:7280 stop:7762 length:483 start_codon:yes stop_codon:yes gene_type:complete
MITLIAAISDNNVIGSNGKIPWYLPEDLRRFKEITLNHPVIMGRKTYESIPKKFRPLPQRKNIVLSSSLKNQKGIYIARTIDEALELTEDRDSYIIGGESVYESFLPIAEELEITRVRKNFEGDAFFPKVNWDEWNLSSEESGTSKNESIPYYFLTYLRK